MRFSKRSIPEVWREGAGRQPLSALALILALSLTAFAQASGPSGTLTGMTQDPNGAAVPGATVTVKHVGTGLTRSATADSNGHWTVAALPVGAYEVTVAAQNFKRTVVQNVQVEAAVPRTLDARLEVGELGDEVVNIPGLTTIQPRQMMTAEIVATDGSVRKVPILCRIDTLDELEYFRNGGILHYVLRNLAAA